jgi:DNA mismatch endonuclease (patch repair protein)
MPDVLTAAQRRLCMSRIRGRNTRPEVALRSALFRRGLRFRIHPRLPGRPDIVFSGARLVIFVDGCFWHGCPKHATAPKANAGFWRRKLMRNVKRDSEVNSELRGAGWRVYRVWEHEIESDPGRPASRIERQVRRAAFRSQHAGG